MGDRIDERTASAIPLDGPKASMDIAPATGAGGGLLYASHLRGLMLIQHYAVTEMKENSVSRGSDRGGAVFLPDNNFLLRIERGGGDAAGAGGVGSATICVSRAGIAAREQRFEATEELKKLRKQVFTQKVPLQAA